MNLINQLESIYPTLSKQEKKVALQVLKYPKKVQTLSIEDLARRSEVSNATVTRFVKKLKYANFSSFKIQLARDDDINLTTVPENVGLATQVQLFYREVIEQTKQRINIDDLKKIVKAITDCRRFYIYGLGSSGYTVREMTQRLIRMGVSAFGMTESHMMYMVSGLLTKDDIVLAISSSGNTADVNKAIDIANQRGAQTFAITGIQNSPLARKCNTTMFVKNVHFVDNTRFINSQFAITYLLDIITTMLLRDDKFRNNMNRTIDMISDQKFLK